jgi:hypothetical protein
MGVPCWPIAALLEAGCNDATGSNGFSHRQSTLMGIPIAVALCANLRQFPDVFWGDSRMSDGEGIETRKKRGCGFWVLVALGVIIAISVFGAIFGDPSEQGVDGEQQSVMPPETGDQQSVAEQEPEPEPTPEPEVNDPGITAAEFSAIQTGMSPDEVAAIVGSPGEVISESDVAGYRTVMVQWDGETGFGANANAMFQNGRLIQKSQFGLE